MIKLQTSDLSLAYSKNAPLALKSISLGIEERSVTAFIGPSGCGKSTFLRCLNRMNDFVRDVQIEGKVLLDGEDIYAPDVDVTDLRRRVGMVFQRPNPFPFSIRENVAYGPNSRWSAPSTYRRSRCGTDMGGAPMSAWPYTFPSSRRATSGSEQRRKAAPTGSTA